MGPARQPLVAPGASAQVCDEPLGVSVLLKGRMVFVTAAVYDLRTVMSPRNTCCTGASADRSMRCGPAGFKRLLLVSVR